MNETVQSCLAAAYDGTLVSELIGAYEEAKRNYYLGGHRLSAVEGGRFCEAAYRILEYATQGSFTPLGRSLDTERIAGRLSSLPANSHSRSLRILIPRALRVAYDIRNNRDAAHLGDDVDPNLQDATLVISVLDWVLAELVRMSGGASADVAQRLVEGLVSRKIPAVQDFGNRPAVLRVNLRAGDFILVLLYHISPEPVLRTELSRWVRESMRANLSRTLRNLEKQALIHQEDETIWMTFRGQQEVERKRLMDRE